jgi:hypothetical protein
MSNEELAIDESNFDTYFKDVRTSKPEKGDVMAKFTAVAEFVEGLPKRDIIDLLKKNKAEQAAVLMQKLHGAREPDCYRVCREMAEDLLTMTDEEVEKKPYEYIFVRLFYTKKEYVPRSQNWELLSVLQYDADTNEYKAKLEI